MPVTLEAWSVKMPQFSIYKRLYETFFQSANYKNSELVAIVFLQMLGK